jgi:hypothetical protein
MMVSLAGLLALCWGVLAGLAIGGVINPVTLVLLAVGAYLALAAVVCGPIAFKRL